MTLYEYDIICARMGAYCERVYRQENLDGEICPKVSACDVQTLEGYELELMKGYGEDFEGIKQQLLELKTNPNRIELVNRYRQKFVVYDMIQALIDDIKGKKVYCPQKAQKRIIGSLERLYQMFFSVSQMCFAEFDGCSLVKITTESETEFKKFFKPEFKGKGVNEDRFNNYLVPAFQKCKTKKEVAVLAKSIFHSEVFASFKRPVSFSEWCKHIGSFCSIDNIPNKESKLEDKEFDWLR